MKRSPIKRKSAKTAARDRRYSKERVPFLEARPLCEICGVARSTEVHHKAGRGVTVFFDQTLWMAMCHDCHEWTTNHPAEAIEQGYSVRRNGAA